MDNDPDQHRNQEIAKEGMLARFIAQETILVLLLSGLAYLCVYYYKRSYLENFGVDRVYVSIDLVDIVVAAAAILAVISIFVQPILIFPPTFFVALAGLLVVNLEIVIVGSFSCSPYDKRRGHLGHRDPLRDHGIDADL